MKIPTSDPSSAIPQINPYIALAIGMAAVSTGAIFARLADAHPLVISAYRVGIASVLLLPFTFGSVKNELIALTGKYLMLAFMSGLFLALHFATWITSLNYTSVANSVVLVTTNPLWVGILSPFILKERLRKATLIGISISVSGGMIIGMGDIAIGREALKGDALALLGSVFAALYLIMGRILRQQLSLTAYIMICYGSSALILWLLVLGLQLPFTGFSTTTVVAFWAMAIVPQLIGHSSYNWSLKWFSSSMVAVSLLGEPIGATILAYIIFHEDVTWVKIAGGSLILFGIWVASRGET